MPALLNTAQAHLGQRPANFGTTKTVRVEVPVPDEKWCSGTWWEQNKDKFTTTEIVEKEIPVPDENFCQTKWWDANKDRLSTTQTVEVKVPDPGFCEGPWMAENKDRFQTEIPVEVKVEVPDPGFCAGEWWAQNQSKLIPKCDCPDKDCDDPELPDCPECEKCDVKPTDTDDPKKDDPDVDPFDPSESGVLLCRYSEALGADSEEYCKKISKILNSCRGLPEDAIQEVVSKVFPVTTIDAKRITFQGTLALTLSEIDIVMSSKIDSKGHAAAYIKYLNGPRSIAAGLAAIAKRESGYTPFAKNNKSTAEGYWQLLIGSREAVAGRATWLKPWPTDPNRDNQTPFASGIGLCDQAQYCAVYFVRVCIILRSKFAINGNRIKGQKGMEGWTTRIDNIYRAYEERGLQTSKANILWGAIRAYWAVGSGGKRDPTWEGVAPRVANFAVSKATIEGR